MGDEENDGNEQFVRSCCIGDTNMVPEMVENLGYSVGEQGWDFPCSNHIVNIVIPLEFVCNVFFATM